jgi:hypothetical protein
MNGLLKVPYAVFFILLTGVMVFVFFQLIQHLTLIQNKKVTIEKSAI